MDWIISIVGGLIGAVIASAFVMLVEHLRKPSLSLEIGDTEKGKYPDFVLPFHEAKWLRLNVENKQLPWCARWLSRNTALHCSALITFYHLDGQDVFGRSMQARWTKARQLLPSEVVIEQQRGLMIDLEKLTPQKHWDIFPGEKEPLDVAGRFDNDIECYGFCDENYSSNPQWRNPKWKLDKGRYLVKVTVKPSVKCCDVFRLINDVTVDDFRLEKAQPGDRKKVCNTP